MMDYKDKIKEILEDKTIPEEQRKKLEEILSTAEKSEDERIRNALITHCRNTRCVTEEGAEMIAKWIAWLEKQSNKPKQKSIWKHWKDGIAGNGEGEPIYLVKNGNTYSLNSCLGCECDYIELSELDKLMLEKQVSEPNLCYHKVDLSNSSEEYRKAYYDGWNNCNMQHAQCQAESNDVIKCLINGMRFYYEDNEEATWGTEKFSMKVKDILSWLEKQGIKPQGKSALEAAKEEKVDNANKVEPPSFDEAQGTPIIKKCREHKF